ncbi:hypothetical protein ACE1SV_63810 [Streptomyces sp. E-15]
MSGRREARSWAAGLSFRVASTGLPSMLTRMSIGVLLSDPVGLADAAAGVEAGADEDAEPVVATACSGESWEQAVAASSSAPTVAVVVRARRRGKVTGCRPAGRAWARRSA